MACSRDVVVISRLSVEFMKLINPRRYSGVLLFILTGDGAGQGERFSSFLLG